MIHSGNPLTAPWKEVSSCWPLQSPFLSLLGAGAAHGMLSTFLRLLGTGRRKEPPPPLQLWLPGWHTSVLEVLPRQCSHRQSPAPGTCSPFWSLVVNRVQGLLKVEQWEHPRVLAQMFLAGCTDLQVGAPRTGGFGTNETITNLLTEKVNRDESLWIRAHLSSRPRGDGSSSRGWESENHKGRDGLRGENLWHLGTEITPRKRAEPLAWIPTPAMCWGPYKQMGSCGIIFRKKKKSQKQNVLCFKANCEFPMAKSPSQTFAFFKASA